MNAFFRRTISIRDVRGKSKQENFYYGILLGLLAYDKEWIITSNAESGDGYSDILIEIEEERTEIVIEIKYAKNVDLITGCKKALEQIRGKNYKEKLRLEGMDKMIAFGIACFKKSCQVMCEM